MNTWHIYDIHTCKQKLWIYDWIHHIYTYEQERWISIATMHSHTQFDMMCTKSVRCAVDMRVTHVTCHRCVMCTCVDVWCITCTHITCMYMYYTWHHTCTHDTPMTCVMCNTHLPCTHDTCHRFVRAQPLRHDVYVIYMHMWAGALNRLHNTYVAYMTYVCIYIYDTYMHIHIWHMYMWAGELNHLHNIWYICDMLFVSWSTSSSSQHVTY